MANHLNLPAEVHDHFRKANVLHGYVEKSLGEATTHALETGQELLEAKTAIPHGRWEAECDRLFDGSARTARFYMAFAKHVSALPKRQASAVLLLEGSLAGIAKAAKQAAKPPAPPPARTKPAPRAPGSSQATPEPDSPDKSPEAPEGPQATHGARPKPDYGKCPNCLGTKWTEDEFGVACAKCHHPWGEPAGDVDEDRLNTQRQKTRKTAEALMRAFDDLQTMKSRRTHGEAIQACKRLLELAKEW